MSKDMEIFIASGLEEDRVWLVVDTSEWNPVAWKVGEDNDLKWAFVVNFFF